MALALAPTPSVDDAYMERRVHVVAVPEGRVVARFEHDGKLDRFRWSRTGSESA